MREYLEEQSLRYRCEYCLAGPQTWCRTRTGAVATMLHSARSDPVRLAWLAGMEEGMKEGQDQLRMRRELTGA